MTSNVGTILLFWAFLSVAVAYFIGAFLAAAKRGPRSDTPVFDRCHREHHGRGCACDMGDES